jgi:hypothetical protein
VEFPPGLLDGAPFYDRYGMPINVATFAQLKFWEEDRSDIVAITEYGDLTVSTVWLGWSEGVDDQGRPQIFETAIFEAAIFDEDKDTTVVARYATEAQAEFHHRLIVGCLRVTRPLPALPAADRTEMFDA